MTRRIAIVDASVLVAFLGIRREPARQREVRDRAWDARSRGDRLVLPWVTVVETSRHIAHEPSGDRRRQLALALSAIVRDACERRGPWIACDPMPSAPTLPETFAGDASRGAGLAESAIRREFERLCATPGLEAHRIEVWSLDNRHLAGLAREPRL